MADSSRIAFAISREATTIRGGKMFGSISRTAMYACEQPSTRAVATKPRFEPAVSRRAGRARSRPTPAT